MDSWEGVIEELMVDKGDMMVRLRSLDHLVSRPEGEAPLLRPCLEETRLAGG